MTILSQIRKKQTILIALTGILILGFLFNFDQFSRFLNPNPNIYGQINHQNISKQEFDILNNILKNEIKNNLLEEITWKLLIKYILINNQCNKLGLQITENNFWKFTQYSGLLTKQYNYFNNNDFFNAKQFKQEIEKIKKKSTKNENYKILYNNWLKEKKIIEYDIKKQLYFSTLLNGLLNNKKEIIFFNQQEKKYAQIEFITINYEDYSKKHNIKVTNQELNSYIHNHPKTFTKDTSIKLEYVLFKNKSSTKDDSIINKEMQTYKKGGIIKNEEGKIIDTVTSFENIKNYNDIESYINTYSDKKLNLQCNPISKYPIFIQQWLKNSKKGNTFGPYLFKNSYIISKLINIKNIDSIECQHILISYQDIYKKSKRKKKEAKKIADSLLTIISKDINKFNKLIYFSDDLETVNKKGYLGWHAIDNENFTNQDNNFFLKKNTKNNIGLIETKLGYHVVNILNKKTGYKFYCIGNLIKDKKPSEKTSKIIENQAINFFKKIKNKPKNIFELIAKKNKYNIFYAKNITRFFLNINDINNYNNEEILKWAFNSKRKIGDVNIFNNSNQDYMVIRINSIHPKGLATTKMVKNDIEKIIRNKKIFKLLVQKINKSKKSLNNLAKEFEIKIQSSTINFENPKIENIGYEPNVAGAALGIKINKISKAIEGLNGVFVIKTNKIFNKKNIDLLQLTKKINEEKRKLAEYKILLELEKKANIKDFRSKIKQ